jgi:hypothetical protein
MKPAFILIFSVVIIASACDNSHKYEINSKDKYESSKEQLAETEKKSPARFLKVEGSNKKNLLGQTVIKGKLYNNARIVTYKDVEIKLSFYSKTGALLEEDRETIYETVDPGAGKSFKSKYFTPKGTDSVSMQVVTAKAN